MRAWREDISHWVTIILMMLFFGIIIFLAIKERGDEIQTEKERRESLNN